MAIKNTQNEKSSTRCPGTVSRSGGSDCTSAFLLQRAVDCASHASSVQEYRRHWHTCVYRLLNFWICMIEPTIQLQKLLEREDRRLFKAHQSNLSWYSPLQWSRFSQRTNSSNGTFRLIGIAYLSCWDNAYKCALPKKLSPFLVRAVC